MFGPSGSCSSNPSGCGIVFKLAPDGTETVLYKFKGGKDGSAPLSQLIMDKKGNLYGTTSGGGGSKCDKTGCGTVFEITAEGKENVLYAFQQSSHGRFPWAGLLLGAHNELYGTTTQGGTHNNGVVFELKK